VAASTDFAGACLFTRWLRTVQQTGQNVKELLSYLKENRRLWESTSIARKLYSQAPADSIRTGAAYVRGPYLLTTFACALGENLDKSNSFRRHFLKRLPRLAMLALLAWVHVFASVPLLWPP